MIQSKSQSSYNKYDVYIFILLLSLSAGLIGNFFSPVRIATVLLLPHLFQKFSFLPSLVKKVFYLFLVWYIWGLFSIVWTVDKIESLKAIVYYFIHFSLFLEIVTFSIHAKNPFKSLSYGWIGAFFFTSFIAIWELFTNNHLSFVLAQSDFTAFDEFGIQVSMLTASATFYNYNGYVTFICFCIPFFLYSLHIDTKVNLKTLLVILLLLLSVAIVFINGSRGGIVSILIFMIIYFFFAFKTKNIVPKIVFLLLLLLSILVIIKYQDIIFMRIAGRMNSLTNSDIEDEPRLVVWTNSLEVLSYYYYLGTGFGGISAAMKEFIGENNILITHSLLLEILVQFGLLIAFLVYRALYIMFRASLKIKNSSRKLVLFSSFFALPIYTIINSKYLYSPEVFAFFASIFVFLYYERIRPSYKKI